MATPDSAGLAAEGSGAAASMGMPQLDFSTYPSQIFWLIVALTALYFILSRVALPRISGAIEERHDTIEDDLERAAEYKRRAHEAELAYEKALAEAKRKAGEIAAEARAEIQQKIDAEMERANAEIGERTAESERRIAEIQARAADDVRAVAAAVAADLVEKLAPGEVSPETASAAAERRAAG